MAWDLDALIGLEQILQILKLDIHDVSRLFMGKCVFTLYSSYPAWRIYREDLVFCY